MTQRVAKSRLARRMMFFLPTQIRSIERIGNGKGKTTSRYVQSTNYATSKPVSRPLPLAKASVSIPIRCIMLTNRLQSGALLSRLKAIC